jgi:hypothetical protein
MHPNTSQQKPRAAFPTRYGYADSITRGTDVEKGAPVSLIGLANHQFVLVAYENMPDNAPLVTHYKQRGDMDKRPETYRGQWIIAWHGEDREVICEQIVHVGPPPDLKLISYEDRRKWWVQAIQILVGDYGLTDLSLVKGAIERGLGNLDLYIKRSYDLLDATRMLHVHAKVQPNIWIDGKELLGENPLSKQVERDLALALGDMRAGKGTWREQLRVLKQLATETEWTFITDRMPDIAQLVSAMHEQEEKLAQNAPDSDKLEDWFDRLSTDETETDGDGLPKWLAAEDAKDRAVYALPKHLARDLGIDQKDTAQIGKAVKACYGTDIISYIRKNGVVAAYQRAVQYCANADTRAKAPPDSKTDKKRETQSEENDPLRPEIRALFRTLQDQWEGEDWGYGGTLENLKQQATPSEWRYISSFMDEITHGTTWMEIDNPAPDEEAPSHDTTGTTMFTHLFSAAVPMKSKMGTLVLFYAHSDTRDDLNAALQQLINDQVKEEGYTLVKLEDLIPAPAPAEKQRLSPRLGSAAASDAESGTWHIVSLTLRQIDENFEIHLFEAGKTKETVKARTEKDFDMLRSAYPELDDLRIGIPTAVDLDVEWKKSAPKGERGTRYKNIVRARARETA